MSKTEEFEGKVLRRLNALASAHEEATLALAYSGGTDSSVLLSLLHRCLTERASRGQKNPRCLLLHFDHQWTEESQDELELCRREAKLYGLPLIEGNPAQLLTYKTSGVFPQAWTSELGEAEAQQVALPPFIQEKLTSLTTYKKTETVARDYRSLFFALVRNYYEQRTDRPMILLLAHQLEDQLETLFLNLFRGCGSRGAAGMLCPREGVQRPLLDVPRDWVQTYLVRKQLAYHQDLSNFSRSTLRNQIRLDLLPILERIFGEGVYDHCFAFSQTMAQQELWIESMVEAYLSKFEERWMKGEVWGLCLNREDIASLDPYFRSRVWKALFQKLCGEGDFSSGHLEALEQALAKQGTVYLSPFFRGSAVVMSQGEIRLWQKDLRALEAPLEWIYIGAKGGRQRVFLLGAKEVGSRIDEVPKVDYNEQIWSPFLGLEDATYKTATFRRRQRGDYVQLQEGRQSFKKYLIEQAVPLEFRDGLLLEVDGQRVLRMTLTGSHKEGEQK